MTLKGIGVLLVIVQLFDALMIAGAMPKLRGQRPQLAIATLYLFTAAASAVFIARSLSWLG